MFKRSVRPSVGWLFIFVLCLVWLESCNNEQDEIPLPPTNPLPNKLCSVNVQAGYTNKVSYFANEKVTVFLQSNEAVDLCRLDIYDVNNNLAFSVASPLSVQTINNIDPAVDGYGFEPTVQFEIPKQTKSGIYLIENKIPFIVKTKKAVDLLIVYPSNTVNAYCESGGKSLYTTPLTDRPFEVSFERPMALQDFSQYCLSWFTTLDEFSFGYICDADLDVYENINQARVLVIPGHNEYWTRQARKNFDQFVDGGRHALILSGNTMWWQVRYNDNKLICYKNDSDPATPLLKTLSWSEPTLEYPILPSIGADFVHGGYGLKADNGWDGYKIINDKSPLLEKVNLKNGDVLKLPTSEYDGTPVSAFDESNFPLHDEASVHAAKMEIIGFDKGSRGGAVTTATFIVMKKSSDSGVIINTASTDWCSARGMGGNSKDEIKRITYNAISKLLNNKEVFSH